MIGETTRGGNVFGGPAASAMTDGIPRGANAAKSVGALLSEKFFVALYRLQQPVTTLLPDAKIIGPRLRFIA